MLNICVLASGGGSNLQAIIDNCENSNINGQVKLVVSNRKDAYALERAEKYNIKNIYLNPKDFESIDIYNEEILKICKDLKIDLIVLAGYLKILSGNILKEYKNRIINIHPSLIPSFCGDGYYGDNVHKKVLEYGVKYTGATVHFVDEGTDTGPIILQKVVSVDDDESLDSLKKKVLKVEHELLPKAVSLICEDRLIVEGRIVKIK